MPNETIYDKMTDAEIESWWEKEEATKDLGEIEEKED